MYLQYLRALHPLLCAPVYNDACKALPPIPSSTEYRATLLSKFATTLAAGCDILIYRKRQDAQPAFTLLSTFVTSVERVAMGSCGSLTY